MTQRKNQAHVGYMSDEEIICLYWNRDEDAIKYTDMKYRQYLLSIALNIVADRQDCEECLNDTYLDAWNSIPPTHPRLLSSFLASIIRRRTIDRCRTLGRQKRLPSNMTEALSELEEILPDDESLLASIDAEELGRSISAFVNSLDKKQRYIFVGRYYFSYPIKKLAHVLGCSVSSVNKELSRLKAELKNKLEGEGYTL